jgi:hypothetical protein
MQTVGMILTRSDHTWSSTWLTQKVVLGWLLTMLRKIPLSKLPLHGLCLDLVFSPRNVRSCGCLKDDLKDPSSWSSSPILFLHDIHSKFLLWTDYNCKETSSQSQVHVGSSGVLRSQDGVSWQQDVPLSIPEITSSLRFPLCGMRSLPTMMWLLSSPRHTEHLILLS